MGKIINKLAKLDPLRGGDVIMERLGLPNMLGEKTGMLTQDVRDEQAAKEQERAMQAQQDRAAQAQLDARTDLRNQDVVSVVEGASAEQAALVRRKQNQSALKPSVNIRRSLGF